MTRLCGGGSPGAEIGPVSLVPAYFHPRTAGEAWRRLLVDPPRMAVVSVDHGPGQARDPGCAAAVAALVAAGTQVLGYADTDFGLRPAAQVRADLRRYLVWYGIRGAFLDQVAASAERLAHYAELVAEVRGPVVLNPGVYPDPAYVSLADILVTFEGPLPAYRAMRVPAWARRLARERFCHLVHGVPYEQVAPTLRKAARHAGTVHVTDRTGAAPWRDLPTYFG
ncbi:MULTISPECIES: spherulation-specific family 4 protein [unclassified Nonomuraea]|uniref:spherulation-specific family 4 protein n=1 Tax=Nonomuraea sp. NPDC003804 TaxID=3154547 RepID=UPI0033B12914